MHGANPRETGLYRVKYAQSGLSPSCPVPLLTGRDIAEGTVVRVGGKDRRRSEKCR
jgi:hypothetical protein